MDHKIYINIPTHSPSKGWHYTPFSTREEFRVYIKSLFKEPGKYNFDVPTVEKITEHARTFQKKKLFCEAPEMSRDYIEFWDTEKEKCRKGCLFMNDKGDVWYIPRFYYHWLNFLRIYFKVAKRFDFAEFRDVHYHIALYEMLAELYDKNIVIMKKRQVASSYFHVAKIYNKYLFEEGYVGKMGASDKKYINATNGSWKFLVEYHNFTNKETAWACTNLPDKEFSWQQKVETKTADGRKVQIGTMATVTGISFDKDAVAGVGGACDELFYEEGGVAPTADITYGYMRQAMREGALTSGIFTIAGSVGDLGQCGPLKEFLTNPVANDFYPIESNLLDEHGTIGITGLFVPEQWSMPPFIDKAGNSLVQEALQYLDEEYARIKKEKSPEAYQLEVSQRPRNIKEAFAIRTVSIFPVKHTTRQVRRIEDGEYHIKHVDIEYNDEHVLVERKSDRLPIDQFPLPKTTEDKRGVICIHESPVKGLDGVIPWGTYYASVDPVEKGITKTSDSLFSIYIYKNPVEVTHIDAEGETTVHLEGDKIVAWWCGRHDDVNETNEQAWKLIQYYNAWTLCENQKTSLINYMIANKGTKYLVPTKEILFDKELEVAQNIHDKFGWSKSVKLWNVMIEYGIDFLSEELMHTYKSNGDILGTIYGVTRIPDIMLLKEMQQYQEKGNFDRIIAYVALIAFAKKQQAERGVKKLVRRDDRPTESQRIPIFDRSSPFKSIGRSGNGFNGYRGKTFKSIG